MKVVLAWFLVVNSYQNIVTFSPPITTEAGCVSAQRALNGMDSNGFRGSRCIQMETWVQK
jgi:hypothetical protein